MSGTSSNWMGNSCINLVCSMLRCLASVALLSLNDMQKLVFPDPKNPILYLKLSILSGYKCNSYIRVLHFLYVVTNLPVLPMTNAFLFLLPLSVFVIVYSHRGMYLRMLIVLVAVFVRSL